MNSSYASLGLALADGQRLVIRAADDEAGECIKRLGQVMQLHDADQGREMLVAVCGSSSGHFDDIPDEGSLLCCLPPRLNPELGVIQMQQVAQRIAQSIVKQGGLQIHGALAEYRGGGFIMAGESGIGKSTASSRLPDPWHSLSDDQSLVVRDRSGHYWAHPWPTWSRVRHEGRGGSWPTESPVPLKAILFLARAAEDRIEPVTTTRTTALITGVSPVPNPVRAWSLASGARRSDYKLTVRAAKALAAAVPGYMLHLSADGEFWHTIERVLPCVETGTPRPAAAVDPRPNGRTVEANITNERTTKSPTRSRSAGRAAGDWRLRMVYTRSTMDPTLTEPDLLEVEPYGSKPVLEGDIVCFKSPLTEVRAVSRVVGLTPAGIHTQGDRGKSPDSWVLNRADLIGRVVVARRGTRCRRIANGRRGRAVAMRVRFTRAVWSAVGGFTGRMYGALARQGRFSPLLPFGLRPRIVRFEASPYVFMRLLIGSTTIGWFDVLRKQWFIRRPFHLFVDERSLPNPSTPET